MASTYLYHFPQCTLFKFEAVRVCKMRPNKNIKCQKQIAPNERKTSRLRCLGIARTPLKEERVGFDNQLGAVERTLQAKVKDYEELLLLSGDANHAREVW